MARSAPLFDEPPVSGDGGKPASAANDASGHRKRLRKRLVEGGAGALGDHEIIELLLMQAVPRQDTKPLARSLLQRFLSLSGVLNADPHTLVKHPGMGEATAAALIVAREAGRRMLSEQPRERPVISSWQALLDYLRFDMAHLNHERVRILYLDTKNRLILDMVAHDGTIDEASVHPREVIHKAMDIGAAALILVHNHPSGSPEPSRADIDVTNRIAEAGRLLGVTVLDHVIVGREGHVSLKAKGLI
jgi:DNA repair protein RadC